jgi:hypothetical protein
MDPERYDPAQRAREKAASRAADDRALASGEKSAEQLRRESLAFSFGHVLLEVPPEDR